MSTMIPPVIDRDSPSSERLVFERLKGDSGTEEWTVLHSLGLAHRQGRPYGEIDFVVLVPGCGVVCLEVKGGRVSCNDGIWRTVDRFDRVTQLSRSPFMQAREGMFAIRKAISQRFGDSHPASQVTAVAGVVFPDVHAPPSTPENEAWEVIDTATLARSIAPAILRMLDCQQLRLGTPRHAVTRQTLVDIRSFLRPDFDRVVTRGTSIQRSEERILRMTEEQLDFLDTLEHNQHSIIEGAAGTGKTTLAMEFAKRSVRQGHSVLLLCFNRLLGASLAAEARSVGNDNLQAGSLHRMLRELILGSAYRQEFQKEESAGSRPELYDTIYPYYGALAAAQRPSKPEILLVDEAQDLVSKANIDVLDALVAGGLARGRWALFGDFTRQAIFARSDLPDETESMEPERGMGEQDQGVGILPAAILGRDVTPLRLILKKNCRNTRPIGEETALLSGFSALPYRLDDRDALRVDYRHWTNREDEARKISVVLGQLLADGVAAGDVAILSPKRFERSAVSLLGADCPAKVAELGSAPGGRGRPYVAFSTVQAFKGMEAPVVLLCDVDEMEGLRAESLLYVGMSRARSHLVVFLKDNLKASLSRLLVRRLTQEWQS